MGVTCPNNVVRWLALAAHKMKEEILRRYKAYAKLFDHPWSVDQLSDSGWLCLVAVPWLLQQMENDGKNHRSNRDANGDPGADSVRASQPPLQFVLSEDSHSSSVHVVVSADPIAKLFGGFLAELESVGFLRHKLSVGWQNDADQATASGGR
jgi:hypothetical protein